jgi:hypothetical protein
LTLSGCSSDDDADNNTSAMTTMSETGGGEAEAGDGDGETEESGEAGDGDGDGEAGDGDGDSDVGAVRLVHLGVFPGDTGTDVDIFVNGEASGISFGFKASTDYVELPVGSYTFDIVPGGGTIDDSVATVPDFAVAAGDSWEIFAYGYVAGADAGEAFTVGAFAENKADIPDGNNRLNIVHAAAAAALSPIDVWAVDADCQPLEPLFTAFSVGEYYEDVDLPDAAFKLGFDVGQDATVDACIEVPALGGAFVNAFAVNDDAGNVSIVAHLPDGTNAELLPE